MSRIKFYLGLRGKSLLIVAIAALILVVIFYGYELPRQDRLTKIKFTQITQQYLHTLATALVSPLLKEQYATVYEELNSQLQEHTDWKNLKLATHDGLLIFPLEPESHYRLQADDIVITADIVFLDNKLGTLYLVCNLTQAFNSSHQLQYEEITLVLAVLMFILLIIWAFIEKIIRYPLARLNQAFDALSQKDYQYPLPHIYHDEVGRVVAGFKSMRTQLLKQQREADALHQKQTKLLETIQESEQHLLLYREQSPIATLEWDMAGRITDWNRTAEKIFGYTLLEVKGKRFMEVLVNQEKNRLQDIESQWQAILSQKGISIQQYQHQTKDGQTIFCEWHSALLKNKQGELIGGASLILDITERKQAEEELQLSARVFNEANEGIMVTDAQGLVTKINPMFTEMTGYRLDEIRGHLPRFLCSEKHSTVQYQEIIATLQQERHWQGELWSVRKNGEAYAQLCRISALLDSQSKVTHYVGLFTDITEKTIYAEKIEQMAHFDVLTGLPNRALFADHFQLAMSRSQREHHLLAICFLDLDGFKPVNDIYGHEVGDQILIEVAKRIKSCIREQDTASRLGGDEFALLLGDMAHIEQCTQAMDRIHDAIAQPYFIEGQQIYVGVSSGITVYPNDSADPDILLRHADQAMYQAKKAGRNRYQFFNVARELRDLH